MVINYYIPQNVTDRFKELANTPNAFYLDGVYFDCSRCAPLSYVSRVPQPCK